jgi:hypothetical protein
MKTPIQEVFSDLEANHNELFDLHTKRGRDFVNNYSKYLDKEKEFLNDFFKFFRDNGENNIGLTIEQFVNLYLKSNVTPESL